MKRYIFTIIALLAFIPSYATLGYHADTLKEEYSDAVFYEINRVDTVRFSCIFTRHASSRTAENENLMAYQKESDYYYSTVATLLKFGYVTDTPRRGTFTEMPEVYDDSEYARRNGLDYSFSRKQKTIWVYFLIKTKKSEYILKPKENSDSKIKRG